MNATSNQKICDEIKKLDGVRFAGVLNDRGKLIEGGMKQGFDTLSSKRDDEMLFIDRKSTRLNSSH